MAEINGEFALPIVFEYSASHFCKFCHTWGNADYLGDLCGNCGQQGYLMPNPFPENKIPYVIFPKGITADILEARAGDERSEVTATGESLTSKKASTRQSGL